MSDHVYVISDRNVGLVPTSASSSAPRRRWWSIRVWGRATGRRFLHATNGVSKNAELYVVSTHFHPEHALGEAAVSRDREIIRAQAQQKDIDEFGLALAKTFASRSPLVADLLEDVQFRKADIFFDREYTARPRRRARAHAVARSTHTRGDTIVWVEGDRILFAGDVVMNRTFVAFASPYSSVRAWLKDFDELEPLHPVKLVPSHGPVGDGSLINAQRTMMKAIQSRATELKRQGKSADETAQTVQDRVPGEVSGLGGAGTRGPHRPDGLFRGTVGRRLGI